MEDHVSMGVHAALKLAAVVRNTRDALAIEALCGAQGLALLRGPAGPGRGGAERARGVEEARRVVREHVPKLETDRALAPDIARVSDLIAREILLAGVRSRIPDLACPRRGRAGSTSAARLCTGRIGRVARPRSGALRTTRCAKRGTSGRRERSSSPRCAPRKRRTGSAWIATTGAARPPDS